MEENRESSLTAAFSEPITFTRVKSIQCTCQDWLEHGAEVLSANPEIREVKLTDKQPKSVEGEVCLWSWPPPYVKTNWRSGSSFLPWEFFRFFSGTSVTFVASAYVGFPSREAAETALSEACLAYGKHIVRKSDQEN